MWVAAGLVALGYLLLATRTIDEPGLYVDELIHVLPSLDFVKGGLGTTAIPGTGPKLGIGDHTMSIMTLDYVGSLNNFMFAPVAAAFDVTAASVRYFAVGTGVLALLATFGFARSLFRSAAIALVAVALLAADPGFVFFTRDDVGPIPSMFLLKALGGWMLLIWWDTGRRLPLAAGAFALGLGVYDKANFLWILAACAIAVALVAGPVVRRRVTRQDLLISAGGFVAGALPLIVYNARSHLGTLNTDVEGRFPGSFPEQIGNRLDVLADLLDGSAVGELVGVSLPAHFVVLPLLFAAAVTAVAVQAIRRRPLSRELAAGAFVVVSLVLTLLIIAAFPSAFRGHHVILAYPLPHLALALVIVQLARAIANRFEGERPPVAYRVALAGATTVPVVLALMTTVGLLDRLAERSGAGLWSDGVYRLASDLQRDHPNDPVVTVDFGMSYNVAALDQDHLRLTDLGFTLESTRHPGAVLSTPLRNPRTVYVLHAPAETQYKHARARFFSTLRARSIRPVLLERVDDRRGPLYELYAARRH